MAVPGLNCDQLLNSGFGRSSADTGAAAASAATTVTQIRRTPGPPGTAVRTCVYRHTADTKRSVEVVAGEEAVGFGRGQPGRAAGRGEPDRVDDPPPGR